MDAKRKQSLKIIIMLSIVWFAAALPVPFLWSNPNPQQPEQYRVYLEIAAIVSIPFIVMGVVWTLKPELATRGSR
jgi:flagellar basal body-associated protein FliL